MKSVYLALKTLPGAVFPIQVKSEKKMALLNTSFNPEN